MSTFIEQREQTNESIKIDTSMSTDTGYFGTVMLGYGAVHVGLEIWEKHGLTKKDKAEFEIYQHECEELVTMTSDQAENNPIWFSGLLGEIEIYEKRTPQAKRTKIVEIIMEIDSIYEIGNWKSEIFDDEVDEFSYPEQDEMEQQLRNEDVPDLEDWYEEQREMRYKYAIENMRDEYMSD
jgi:hypothetical protein